MNAVNNGPVYKRTGGQNSGNLDTYTAANIPFARTHDASFCSSYGGEHTVDVHLIFRDFDADPYDPASYDFHLTDEYMDTIKLAGTERFIASAARSSTNRRNTARSRRAISRNGRSYASISSRTSTRAGLTALTSECAMGDMERARPLCRRLERQAHMGRYGS